MRTATQPYVGHEIRVPAGILHRGITQHPEQTLAEHRERLGPQAFIRILTRPLTLRQARQWAAMRESDRHYQRTRPTPGRHNAIRQSCPGTRPKLD